jgi:ATP-dependent Clp protease ATP-binding subunit ClpB
MLRPMLARGELRIIGATTLDEYQERIEKDSAFERRFQQVLLGEPSVEDTIAILRGLKGRYEAHHQVQISDAALVAAAALSDRHITGRFLTDKAIDVVDEAAARLRMEIDSGPVEIDELRRAVDWLTMEELALANQEDAASKERLERLRATKADRQEQLNAAHPRSTPPSVTAQVLACAHYRRHGVRGSDRRTRRGAPISGLLVPVRVLQASARSGRRAGTAPTGPGI